MPQITRISEDEFLTKLKAHIKERHSTYSHAARVWGVSQSFVSKVTLGQTAPNATILKEMRMSREKVVIYWEIKNDT